MRHVVDDKKRADNIWAMVRLFQLRTRRMTRNQLANVYYNYHPLADEQ
jgi:hypothetical protein